MTAKVVTESNSRILFLPALLTSLFHRDWSALSFYQLSPAQKVRHLPHMGIPFQEHLNL